MSDEISSFDYLLWQPFAHLEFSPIAELQAVTRQFIRIFESSPLNLNGFILNLILLVSFVGINCNESSAAQLRKKETVKLENVVFWFVNRKFETSGVVLQAS